MHLNAKIWQKTVIEEITLTYLRDRMAIVGSGGPRQLIPVIASILLSILLIVSIAITVDENEQIVKLKQQTNDLGTELRSVQARLDNSTLTTEQLQETIFSLQEKLGTIEYELNYSQTRLQEFMNYNSTIPLGGTSFVNPFPAYDTSIVNNVSYAGYLVVNVSTSSSNSTLNISWDVHGYHYFTSEVVGYHNVMYALVLPSSILFTVGPALTGSFYVTLYY